MKTSDDKMHFNYYSWFFKSHYQYQQDNEQSPFKLKISTRLFNEWYEL